MRKYWAVFRNGLQLSFSYRGEIFFRAVRHLIVVSTFVFIWAAIFKNKVVIGGYTLPTIITYYILIEIIDVFYTSKSGRYLAKAINNGELNNFLTKPLNYWGYSFSRILAEQIGTSSLSLVLVLLSFIFLPNFTSLPQYPQTPFIFLLALVFSWILNFQIFFLLGILAFWFSSIDYFRAGLQQIMNILGGKWLPLDFFNGSISLIIGFLPFQFLLSFVAKIYQEKLTMTEASQGLVIEMLWILSLIILGKSLWSKGLRIYQAYGA